MIIALVAVFPLVMIMALVLTNAWVLVQGVALVLALIQSLAVSTPSHPKVSSRNGINKVKSGKKESRRHKPA